MANFSEDFAWWKTFICQKCLHVLLSLKVLWPPHRRSFLSGRPSPKRAQRYVPCCLPTSLPPLQFLPSYSKLQIPHQCFMITSMAIFLCFVQNKSSKSQTCPPIIVDQSISLKLETISKFVKIPSSYILLWQ